MDRERREKEMSKDIVNIPIKDIVKDEDIYPRRNESPKTIEAYAESLEAGAKFPPILVQRISTNDGEEYTVFLDGLHRARAHEQVGRKSIEAQYWKDEVLEKEKWLTQLALESARRNSIHGDRLSRSDKENQARKICEKNPDITEQEIAEALEVSQQTVSNWVSDIKLMQKAERQAIIYKLNLLGWTQEDIAKVIGLARSTIAERMSDLPKLVELTKSLLERGDPIEKVAEKLKIDLILAWAILLDGKGDLERFKSFGEGEYQNTAPLLYNVWNFMRKDQRLGLEVKGNIPGQIAMNILYYYTNQGDLVVDPMAGGGSTVDACLVMGRRCRAYDITPREGRNDILKHDIREGFLREGEGCDLIFLDPPYWRLQKGNYSKESVSEYGYEDWLNFMKKLASDCYKTLKKGGHIVLVIEAFLDERVTGKFLDLSLMCLKFFLDAGFTQIQRVTAPMPSEIKSVQDVEYAKKKKIMLDLNRDILIFKKE
jgi:transcriptional regulator with XRE-family HTH domain/uncharacterized ParB-like nuclease family protein